MSHTDLLVKKMNQENKLYYEHMKLYIEMTQELTQEEIDQLTYDLAKDVLRIQAKGQVATDLYGTNLIAYCNELIEQKKDAPSLFGLFLPYIALFFGIILLYYAFVNLLLNDYFDVGYSFFIVSSGKLVLVFLAQLILINLFLYFFFIKQTKLSKTLLLGLSLLVISVLLNLFMPEFGPYLDLNQYAVLTLGGTLIAVFFALRK